MLQARQLPPAWGGRGSGQASGSVRARVQQGALRGWAAAARGGGSSGSERKQPAARTAAGDADACWAERLVHRPCLCMKEVQGFCYLRGGGWGGWVGGWVGWAFRAHAAQALRAAPQPCPLSAPPPRATGRPLTCNRPCFTSSGDSCTSRRCAASAGGSAAPPRSRSSSEANMGSVINTSCAAGGGAAGWWVGGRAGGRAGWWAPGACLCAGLHPLCATPTRAHNTDDTRRAHLRARLLQWRHQPEDAGVL